MTQIVGCVALSHGPQLVAPAARWSELPDRAKPPYNVRSDIAEMIRPETMQAHEERCKKGIESLRQLVEEWNPDTLVVLGDDQGENLLKDNMPPFTIYIGEEADASMGFRKFGADEAATVVRYTTNAELAKQCVSGLMTSGFDPAWSKKTRYPFGLGHAFGRVLKWLDPEAGRKVLPIMVNTYFPPAPSARRCHDFGAALSEVLTRAEGEDRVVLVASGGLSHTKIDEQLDLAVLKAMETRDSDYLRSIPSDQLREGTSEILNWIAVSGAAKSSATVLDYVPCYRNDRGVGCAMGFAYWPS